MERNEKIVVKTRLGIQEIDKSKILYFPKGLVGFENTHEFTLLQIREGAPMLMLQSIDDPNLGLLVADPYFFLPDYSLKIGDAEQKLLCLKDPSEATVLVTVSIPHGKPHLTSLNLTGPIIINSSKKFGLQVPQSDVNPKHVLIESLVHQSKDESTAASNTKCCENSEPKEVEKTSETASQVSESLNKKEEAI